MLRAPSDRISAIIKRNESVQVTHHLIGHGRTETSSRIPARPGIEARDSRERVIAARHIKERR